LYVEVEAHAEEEVQLQAVHLRQADPAHLGQVGVGVSVASATQITRTVKEN
jgi:hypothetical protein